MCLKISLKVRIILKACMKQTYTSHIQYIIYIIYTSYIHHIYITYTSYIHHIYIIYTSYTSKKRSRIWSNNDPNNGRNIGLASELQLEVLLPWPIHQDHRAYTTLPRPNRKLAKRVGYILNSLRYIEIYWDILRYRDILRYIEIYWDYEIENQYVIETKMKLIDTDWQIRHCCLIENDSNIFQHYNTASSATVLLLSCCSAARCHASGLAASSPPTSTSSKRACAEQSAPQPLEASASTPSLFSPTPWPQEISKF